MLIAHHIYIFIRIDELDRLNFSNEIIIVDGRAVLFVLYLLFIRNFKEKSKK